MHDRFEDWPTRLSRVCQEWAQVPHDWDGADCATFAAECALAITGVDFLDKIRGRYTTPIGAARVIKSEGFDSLEEMLSAHLEACEVNQAGRGDVVLFDGEHGDFMAVVVGIFAVAPGAEGLVQTHLKFAKAGFKI